MLDQVHSSKKCPVLPTLESEIMVETLQVEPAVAGSPEL